MAKQETKKRYVCLGDNATIFHDPNSRMKVISNWAVEIPANWRSNKRLNKAIKNGHLDFVDSADMDNYEMVPLTGRVKGAAAKVLKQDEGKDAGDQEVTHESLMKLKKPALIKLAEEAETEFDDTELEGMTKTELADEIMELNAEE